MKKIKMIILLAVFFFGFASTDSGACVLWAPSWDNDGWCSPIPESSGFECVPWGPAHLLPNCKEASEGGGDQQ